MDVRRIAARILKVGESRIYFDKDHLKEISEAITARDVRRLIKQGYIRIKPAKKNLSIRAKLRKRRRGPGKIKGAKYSRLSKKERWMIKIRAQRKFLKELKEKGIIDTKLYRELYRKAKAGMFRSKAHLRIYLEKLDVDLKKKPEIKKEQKSKAKEKAKKK